MGKPAFGCTVFVCHILPSFVSRKCFGERDASLVLFHFTDSLHSDMSPICVSQKVKFRNYYAVDVKGVVKSEKHGRRLLQFVIT